MRVIYIFYGALQLYKSRIIIHAAYCNAGVIQRRGCIVSAFCNFALAPPPPLTFDKLHTIVLCIGYISSMCRIAGLLRRRARSKRGRRSDSTLKEKSAVPFCAVLCAVRVRVKKRISIPGVSQSATSGHGRSLPSLVSCSTWFLNKTHIVRACSPNLDSYSLNLYIESARRPHPWLTSLSVKPKSPIGKLCSSLHVYKKWAFLSSSFSNIYGILNTYNMESISSVLYKRPESLHI